MKKILIIAAIVLTATGAWAGEKENLTFMQEHLVWKSRAIQCEATLEMQKMQAEFKVNQDKLKELEAKEKKEKKADTGKK
jgi:hypothetical protein